MKICYVAADITIPGIMGGSTHTFEVARNLVRLGHEVTVVCRREHGQKSYELYEGVHLYRLHRGIIIPTKRTLWKKSAKFGVKQHIYRAYLLTFFFFYAGLMTIKVIKTHNADIILERGTSLGEGAFASIVTRRPLVLEIIGPRYSSLSFKKAKKILTFSAQALKKPSENKVEVVTAAVNTDLFNPKIDSSQIRVEHGLKNFFVIGYAGSFAPWHGVETLLSAMEHVIRHRPKSKLMLVGPYPKEIIHNVTRLKLEKHVVLTGPVPYSTVPSYLAACDVLVAPYSHREWGGFYSYIKIYEYMAMAKPIITTNIIPDAEIIRERNTGILIQHDNPLKLSNAILRISNEKELAHTLAQNARQTAIEHSWSAYSKRLVNLFKSAFRN